MLIELRHSFRELAPDLDDHVFTVEVEVWISQFTRERRRKDPKKKRSAQSLWRLVKRVSARAEITALSPHPLRHGFANRFLRESRRDVFALQGLMGHSQLETTRGYLDEIDIDDLADALDRAAEERHAQASSELDTESDEGPEALEALSWRRWVRRARRIPPGRRCRRLLQPRCCRTLPPLTSVREESHL